MATRSISFHTTSAGLRIVHLKVPGAEVGYCGVVVRVGSRDEDKSRYGLAHFVEHTIFKGTTKRKAWHIINRMEAVGGELNAYTTKEETVVYSAFPSGNLSRAAELIADLITSSTFPEHELQKEREVVADEIDSYLDTPSEAVFDDFEENIFKNSSLSHNILGNRQSLASFSSEICRDYLARWYVPENMVAFYAGNRSAESVFSTLEKEFAALSGTLQPVRRQAPAVADTFNIYKVIDSHQCHTIMGAAVGSLTSPDRYTQALFTNILGGPGMNSLLNVSLREKRGLVYNVEASTGLYSDCGALSIYYGCDPHDNDLCRKLVGDTISSVADGFVSSRRLQAAKKQYLGQLVIASENIENRILSIARQYLFTGKLNTLVQITEAINEIGTDDIKEFATGLRLSSITLGPR